MHNSATCNNKKDESGKIVTNDTSKNYASSFYYILLPTAETLLKNSLKKKMFELNFTRSSFTKNLCDSKSEKYFQVGVYMHRQNYINKYKYINQFNFSYIKQYLQNNVLGEKTIKT